MALSRGCRISCRHEPVSASWPHDWLAHKQLRCVYIAGAKPDHCATHCPDLIPCSALCCMQTFIGNVRTEYWGMGLGLSRPIVVMRCAFFIFWFCLMLQLLANVMQLPTSCRGWQLRWMADTILRGGEGGCRRLWTGEKIISTGRGASVWSGMTFHISCLRTTSALITVSGVRRCQSTLYCICAQGRCVGCNSCCLSWDGAVP